MIYIDSTELSWSMYTESWLTARFTDDEDCKVFLKELFEKWIPRVLKFKELNCMEPVKISDFIVGCYYES